MKKLPDYMGFDLARKPAEEPAYLLEEHTTNLIGPLDSIAAENVAPVMQHQGYPIALGYGQAGQGKARGLLIWIGLSNVDS